MHAIKKNGKGGMNDLISVDLTNILNARKQARVRSWYAYDFFF